jgi:hypothetical protein
LAPLDLVGGERVLQRFVQLAQCGVAVDAVKRPPS